MANKKNIEEFLHDSLGKAAKLSPKKKERGFEEILRERQTLIDKEAKRFVKKKPTYSVAPIEKETSKA